MIDALRSYSDEQVRLAKSARSAGDFDDFRPGDSIEVTFKLIDSDIRRLLRQGVSQSELQIRTQTIKGVCISLKNKNEIRSTFSVLRSVDTTSSFERAFPLYSPLISSIKITKSWRVRRAKLYYLRTLHGKAARLKEIPLATRFAKMKAFKEKQSALSLSRNTSMDFENQPEISQDRFESQDSEN